MTKIAIVVAGKEAAFINNPSDFPALQSQLISGGVEASEISLSVPSLKSWAKSSVAVFAESYRAMLATQSAGKLAEYRIKEEIARAPDAASQAELDLLSREAKARGTNRTGLLGQIAAQASGFRQVALLIGVLEAEANAAISSVSDEAVDATQQIEHILTDAQEQAQAALAEAAALLAG